MLAQFFHALTEIRGVAAAQEIEQRRAEGVVHEAVRFAPQQVLAALGVGDLRCAVLPHFAEEVTVGAFLLNAATDARDEFVGQFIGDIQPPAGRARAQPAADDGIVALDDIVDITLLCFVDGGEVLDAPPCVVIVGEGVEAVPAVVGRLLTLRRAERGIKAVSVKIDAFSPRVVENAVEQHADAAPLCLRAERAKVLFVAEQRVDALVAGRVVAMVGRGLEDRAEVERRHAEGGKVVELFRDAREVAAKKVAARDLALGVRAVFRGFVPALVQRARTDKACGVSLFCAMEAVGEDLIRHAAAEPFGRFVRIVVDRELPGLDRVPRAEA